MPHDNSYRDANQFGQRVHELLFAHPDRQPSLGKVSGSQPETIHDAFDELQGMSRRQLLAAWDGLLQRAECEQHIASRLASITHCAHVPTTGSSEVVEPVLDASDAYGADVDDLEESDGDECDECYSVITSDSWFSVEHAEFCSLYPDNVY